MISKEQRNQFIKIYEVPIYVNVDNKDHIVCPDRVSEDSIRDMLVRMGSYTFNTQNLLTPVSEGNKKFKMEWLLYWTTIPKNLKVVITVDPANSKKKRSDYTAMIVHGFDEHQNWYILDIYRDKLDKESLRSKRLFEIHRKWSKIVQNRIPVLYETVGFQLSDKNYIERTQDEEDYHFPIYELSGGVMHTTSKKERIKALQPYFERNMSDENPNKKKCMFIPKECMHHSYYEAANIDMVKEFIYEYCTFTPDSDAAHDDILDCISFPLYWDGFKNIRSSVVLAAPEPKGNTWGEWIEQYTNTGPKGFYGLGKSIRKLA